MSGSPISNEQHAAHLPALHLLCNLGWNFLTTAQALAMRGNTREVLLRSRLVEVLQTRRYEYKGSSTRCPAAVSNRSCASCRR
jgi:type I restriction enzyme R subunit